MVEPHPIKLDALKEFSDRIFDVLRRRGAESVPFPATPYWSIGYREMLSPEIPIPVLGDPGQDFADLSWELSNADEAVDLAGSCRAFANLLNVIAHAEAQGRFTNAKRRGTHL